MYKIKFIDSYRFLQSKLSKLIDNLSGIAKIDCIACKERKKNLYANLLSLKIINYCTNAKNAKNDINTNTRIEIN